MIHIEATRDRPTEPRLEQLAGVLTRFQIIPHAHPGLALPDLERAQAAMPSRFSWRNEGDGKRITLAIDLAEDDKAADLIRELRMCGFVANVTGKHEDPAHARTN